MERTSDSFSPCEDRQPAGGLLFKLLTVLTALLLYLQEYSTHLFSFNSLGDNGPKENHVKCGEHNKQFRNATILKEDDCKN